MAIFEYWIETFNKKGTVKLTDKRKKNIHARLKEGYTLEDIKGAIWGCSMSEYHMGKNDSGTVYDDIELICRSGEKLEKFRDTKTAVRQVVAVSEVSQQNVINMQGFVND